MNAPHVRPVLSDDALRALAECYQILETVVLPAGERTLYNGIDDAWLAQVADAWEESRR